MCTATNTPIHRGAIVAIVVVVVVVVAAASCCCGGGCGGVERTMAADKLRAAACVFTGEQQRLFFICPAVRW